MPHFLIAMLALTFGLPVLLFFAVASSNGVSPAMFTNFIGGAVFTLFLVLAVFEIKRLADQTSDPH